MVDDRALRFRRRTPVGEPPGQTRTDSGGDSLNFLDYFKTFNPLSMSGMVNDSLVRPTGETAAQGYFPSTFGAENPGAGEAATDLGMLAAGGVASKLIGAAARPIVNTLKPSLGNLSGALSTYMAMSPQNRALYNSMLRGVKHGSRDTGASVAQPFTFWNRSMPEWARNWFGGDVFGTVNPTVAGGYTTSSSGVAGPGTTAKGFPLIAGARYTISEPIEQVANRKILDLVGRTLDEADPALYKRLTEEFGQESIDFGTDLAQMVLSGPGLHQSRYSQAVRPILEEFGYDTVRYLSGQAQGKVAAPVYAFLNPAGMKATPMLPTFGRAADLTDEAVKNALNPVFTPVDNVVGAITRAPKTVADTLADVLSQNDVSRFPAGVRNFVNYRTRMLPAGEQFQDVVPHAVNDRLAAFLRRLGVDRLARNPEVSAPRRRPALPLEDTYEILD